MSLTPVLTKRFGTDQPWKIANYERLAAEPSIPAGETLPGDRVIHRGTGEGWAKDGDV